MIKDVEPLLKECEETLTDLKELGNIEAACYVKGFINSINRLPEVKRQHGEWVRGERERILFFVRKCSQCGEKSAVGDYCMWCGSDNRAEKSEKEGEEK